MRLLQRVVVAGLIDLVVSRMVLREYDTKRISELASRAQSTKDSLKEIAKIFTKANQAVPVVESLDAQLTDALPGLQARLQATTDSWIEDFKITVIDPHPSIYESVWDDYFAGKGAFKRPKNRDDLPDAVIGKSLQELVKDGGGLTFICKDGQLKEFMASLPQVRVFSELSELIRSPEFEEMLSELDAQDLAIDEFKNAIGSGVFLSNVIKYFSAKDSDFDYSYWEDEMIENLSELPLPVRGGVSAGGPVISSIKDLDFGPVSCIDSRHYVLTVRFKAYLPISFVGDYADWIHAPEDIKSRVEILSANGDGACEYGAMARSTVVGEIVVHLRASQDPKSLLIHSQYIGAEDSPLDIEFVPKKVVF